MKRLTTHIVLILPLLLSLTAGCDDRSTRIAREAADRQAQQNTAMANLNQEVASGSRALVAADAQARKDFVGVHHDLQSERSRLDSGWDKLENERRELAHERQSESWLSSTTTLAIGLMLTAMVLGFCWLVLSSAHRDTPQAELSDFLVQEVLSDRPHPLLGGGRSLLTGDQVDCEPKE